MSLNKNLENTYRHVLVRANTKVKTRPQTQKPSLEDTSTSLPYKEVIILTDCICCYHTSNHEDKRMMLP